MALSTLSKTFDKISEINDSKSSWSVKAKVIRLWVVKDFNRNDLPFSVEMGDRIHCSVRKTLLYKFAEHIKEGRVYSFENLDSATNGGTYKTTKHGYKLTFQFGSKVNPLGPNKLNNLSPFKFVPIGEVNNGSYDSDYLVDVIGMLTGVGEERQYEARGQSTKLNVIELEADGEKIQCTLFGSYVDELNNFLSSGETQNTAVIIMFGKVKLFQEKLHIQNCLNCTKVFYNPVNDDVTSLRSRMVQNLDTPSPLILTQIIAQPRVDPLQEFLYSTPRNTIQGLLNCEEDAIFVVLGTIKHIVNNDNWFYTACACNKSVYPDSGMYFCEKCNKHVKNVSPRFSIKVRVMDDTDSATFVLFDRDAAMLFNKSCAEVLRSRDTRVAPTVLPAEIKALVNSTYLFKVECKAPVSHRFEPSFRVRKICTDMILINQFKSKWEHEESTFAKNANEMNSLSALHDTQIGSSANYLDTNNVEPLTASSTKEKEIKLDCAKLGISQDLMPSFSEAVIDVDGIPSPKKVDAKGKAKMDNHTTKGKRASPNDETKTEDMDLPIKLLKRAIKIEKI
ncbi:replication protein A 70 kDa DNA-binding subunit E [Trifolium repens]|nr:replication protein A 70 kDa DNA-binding subunit E [Trifolium repens]